MKRLFLLLFFLCGCVSLLYAEIQSPTIDLSQETDRQVVIAAGTPEIYQGHPYSVMMPDQKTIFAVWSINHGGFAGPAAKSTDGGLTWTRIDEKFPDEIHSFKNCPSIFRLTNAEGKSFLWVLGSLPGMPRAVSADDGETWTIEKPLGIPCVMTFSSVIPKHPGIQDGCYLGFYHHAVFNDGTVKEGENGDVIRLEVAMCETSDAGWTWSEPKIIGSVEGKMLCEPFAFWSPDQKEICCLMRENTHKSRSMMMFSQDFGATWSMPVEASEELTGDRHIGVPLADGRYFFAFRDRALSSPTLTHFVGWIGTYDDIKNARPGQRRIKLLHSFAEFDNGYSGVHQLADGTVIVLTYIKYEKGPNKHSVVETRFKPEEIDQKLAEMKK